MNKTVFSRDYKAVDAEIERLRPLIELGGYLPCPDHRIAPDAKFENVQYYCCLLYTSGWCGGCFSGRKIAAFAGNPLDNLKEKKYTKTSMPRFFI